MKLILPKKKSLAILENAINEKRLSRDRGEKWLKDPIGNHFKSYFKKKGAPTNQVINKVHKKIPEIFPCRLFVTNKLDKRFKENLKR